MKNERLYTLTELVSFGNYLLSENRKQSIVHEHASDVVHEEDIANWVDGCDVVVNRPALDEFEVATPPSVILNLRL